MRRRVLIGASVLALLVAAAVVVPKTLIRGEGPAETLFGKITPVAQADQEAVTVGTQVTADQPGTITAVRFYKGAGNTGSHLGAIYGATGKLLAKTTFTKETASGWQTATLASRLTLKAGLTFYVAVFMPRGGYVAQDVFPWPHRSPSLTATSAVYTYGSELAYPTKVYKSANYFIDVEFTPRHKSDPRPAAIPPTPAAARVSSPSSTTGPPTTGPSTTGPASAPPATNQTAEASTTSRAANGLLTSDPSFFPIAVWDQTLASNGANYKAIGVNTFLGLYHGYSTAEIDAAAANGLYAIGGQSSLAINSALGPKVIPGWLDHDEPDNAQPLDGGGYGPCIPVSTLISKYQASKSADPLKRPVIIGFGRGVSDVNWVGRGTCTGDTAYYQKAAAAADIFAYDIYPVNSGEADNLQAVARGVDNLRGWVGPNKPVWVHIETTPYDKGNPAPTPAQTKFEVWSAIIHGARGVSYFCHIFSPTFHEDGLLTLPQMKAGVQQINAQITDLAPVINAGTPVPNKVTSAAGSSVPVDTMTKRYRGSIYIIAADMRNTATTATFQPAGVTTGTVSVLGENRTITLTNGSFTDKFAGYGVHIYKITD
ncbi:MAG TPA: DUF4082 domain-containing protein [Microlunatus sp.]